MDVKLAPLLGRLSTNCPVYEERPCYEPCLHEQEVVDFSVSPVIGGDEFLGSLIKAQLKTQADFIKCMCEWTADPCLQGLWLGFPCVQCGLLMSDGDIRQFECNGETYAYCEFYDEYDYEFDFYSSPESIILYQSIISALKSVLVSEANILSVDNFVKAIWGELAETVFLKNTFYVWPGRNPTDIEKSIQNILSRVIPLPVCTEFKLVSKN